MREFHFYPVDREAIDKLLEVCRRHQFPPKTTVVAPGETAESMYYVVEGSLTVSAESKDEKEHRDLVLAYLNPGDFLGELGLFMEPRNREVTVKTRTRCELAEISYNRLRELLHGELQEHAYGIMNAVAAKLAQRLLQTRRKVYDLAFVDTQGRIARALIDLCSEPDAVAHPDGTQIRITRRELSRIVGCSREMAGRVMKTLEEDGMIQTSGSSVVLLGTHKGAVG